MDVVDPAHRRPVLLPAQRGQRIGRLLAAVGMRPFSPGQRVRGVRRMLERVVVPGPGAALDLRDLGADRDHRGDEAVELDERLALGGLDHQRAGHRKAQRRRVEAVVDEPLGDVLGADAGAVLQPAQVEDAFVRHAAALELRVGARIEHRVVVGQPGGDVVRAQDRHLGGRAQGVGTHHAAVHPADRQHAGVAQRCRAHRADRMFAAEAGRAVGGQERHQVGHHRDRAHARSAAAVRDAEGLVQIEVADVAAELARRRDADQRIHVGAVDVDAAAVAMDQRAQLLDAGLEHAMRARVGDHRRGELGAVLLALGGQVVHVDVAHRVALDDDDAHAGHLRAGAGWCHAPIRGSGRCRAGRRRATDVPGPDHEQPGVLALAAGVGLQADAGVAGGLARARRRAGRSAPRHARQLVARRERMQLRELGPGDRGSSRSSR